MMVKELLLSSNYWVLNKTVVKTFGIETAFLLTSLAEAEQMMSTDDGWFYQTSDTLEELTTLSRYKQDNAIEQLEKAGILEKDVRGIPAKRYFKLDYKALANKILNNSQTRVKKNDKLELKKLTTNKESTNKESTNKQSTNKPSSAELTEDFEKLWNLYPNKQGKKKALAAYKKAIKAGATNKQIKDGIVAYKKYLKREEWQKPAFGSTWFHYERWNDDYSTAANTSEKEELSFEEKMRRDGVVLEP